MTISGMRSEIGNPHGYIHICMDGRQRLNGSRWTKDNQILSLVKIQSTPRSKDVDHVYERHGWARLNKLGQKSGRLEIGSLEGKHVVGPSLRKSDPQPLVRLHYDNVQD